MPRRRILITGATKGLGRAMAEQLATPEAEILVPYREEGANLSSVLDTVQAAGAWVTPIQADLAIPTDRQRLAQQVARGRDTLQVLIHSASLYHPEAFLDSTAATWARTLEVNCTAIYHLTTLLVPLLQRGAPARVINLGDAGDDRIRARLEATPYHISKLGVLVLTRSFAEALTPLGITVNQISPGILENSIDGPQRAIPAGRPGSFADILGAVDYLLSPAAEYVSGANIIISGGWNL